jgi:sigma-B regulation protein RsbU (phosphoserine phosphatase)
MKGKAAKRLKGTVARVRRSSFTGRPKGADPPGVMTKDIIALSNIILDSLHDGLYVCDRERRIVYWSKSAERITGWTSEDVVGRQCREGILCHTDKDGRRLCDEEFCPLHRCMVTGKAGTYPVVVFARTKQGRRLPMLVSVSPIHGDDGKVVGGVETFRDFSESFANLERAKRIQTLSLEHDLPRDPRVCFSTFYLPYDVVGGDYFSIRALDDNRYGFFLADVMGHGFAAALHTMHLSSLWSRHSDTLVAPVEFARRLNGELGKIVKDETFATGLCGVIDAEKKILRFTSAGGPPIVLLNANGEARQLEAPGLPFGVLENADYDEVEISCASGDCLLLFSDGVVEVQNAEGQMLGTEGLIDILKDLGYPRSGPRIEPLQEALLRFSNGIRLEDDVTFMEIRFS